MISGMIVLRKMVTQVFCSFITLLFITQVPLIIAIAASSLPNPLSTSTINFSALLSGLIGCKAGPRPQNRWNLLNAAVAIDGTRGSIHKFKFVFRFINLCHQVAARSADTASPEAETADKHKTLPKVHSSNLD